MTVVMSLETNSWRNFIATNLPHRVPPVRSLRPGHEAFFQYVDPATGEEKAAVHSKHPYGPFTEYAFTNPEDWHLLEAREQHDAYTTFLIPGDTITVRATALGGGRRGAETLYPVFRALGEVIGSFPEVNALPLLSLGDLAIKRTGGDIVFIPPVGFGETHGSVEATLASVATSTLEALRGYYSTAQIESLNARLLQGAKAS